MSTAVSAPPRGPKPMTEESKGRVEQTLLYVIVIVPFLALAGAVAVAWGWGINGAFSVIGATLAVFIAMNWGFSVTLLTGAVVYAAAAATLQTR